MKKSIFKIVVFLTFLMIIIGTGIVNADDKNQIVLTSDKTVLKKGEEIQVTISSQQNITESVQMIYGVINYDHSILELEALPDDIESAKVENKNNWEAIVGTKESKMVVQSLKAQDGEMVTITFKVLKDTKNTKISISDLKVFNANYSVDDLKANELNINANSKLMMIIIVSSVIIVLIVAAVIVMTVLKRKKK